mmetsp:Transcript_26681/g.42778  ORF Transcript_26681/g.42778 Transcript_26681/m.42778 type:complete len:87 (-) Transcript_26681:953-1213(-)
MVLAESDLPNLATKIVRKRDAPSRLEAHSDPHLIEDSLMDVKALELGLTRSRNLDPKCEDVEILQREARAHGRRRSLHQRIGPQSG